jgi:hypothetical protein
MKIMSIQDRRQQAKNEAWYARTNLRRRLEENPTVQVESKSERWLQKARQAAAAKSAGEYRDMRVKERQLQEQREHEIELAKATGRAAAQANAVVDADTLTAISDALNSLVRRLEIVEERVESLSGAAADTGRRVDAVSAKLKSADEKKGRQVATIERQAADQKDLVHDLKTEVRVLRAKVHAVENKPQQQETQVIREVVYR